MTLKRHARRIVSSIPDDIRQALALNPADALTRLLNIYVAPLEQLRDSRGAGGWCDGVSLATNRVICYAPTPGSRRQNFTLIHEFAHLCVNEDNESLDWLADRTDPSGDLERLCDAIAAEILLPPSTVTSILARGTPEPRHLRQLYADSHASEEVCAIALAAHLPVRGAVMLIHRKTATVTFAASSGWPPLHIPRGLLVPPRHPLRELGIRQRWYGWTTPDLRLAFPEQSFKTDSPQDIRSLLKVRAEAGPRRTTAILLDATSISECASGQTSITEPEPLVSHRSHHPGERACPICGHATIDSFYPCEECHIPPCPACGRCQCL